MSFSRNDEWRKCWLCQSSAGAGFATCSDLTRGPPDAPTPATLASSASSRPREYSSRVSRFGYRLAGGQPPRRAARQPARGSFTLPAAPERGAPQRGSPHRPRRRSLIRCYYMSPAGRHGVTARAPNGCYRAPPDEDPSRDRWHADEDGAHRASGRRRRFHEEARQDHSRCPVRQHRRVATLGRELERRGFGSFRLWRRGPRAGRNPRTRDLVDAALKHVAYFKPRKERSERLNRDPA